MIGGDPWMTSSLRKSIFLSMGFLAVGDALLGRKMKTCTYDIYQVLWLLETISEISGKTTVRDVAVCRRERCLPIPPVGLVFQRCSMTAQIQAGRFACLSPLLHASFEVSPCCSISFHIPPASPSLPRVLLEHQRF